MNLYRWDSVLMKGYSDGDIIVMAESVDEARSKAAEGFWRYIKEDYEYLLDNLIDDWMEEELDEKRAIFEKDIAKEPELVTSGVLFMKGSQ